MAQDWHLYWVSSDGYEDCFVAAKNSRSARSVECQMNGFLHNEVVAERIAKIPKDVVDKYRKSKDGRGHPWPWYVYGKGIFEKLGAQFRNVDNKQEMLINECVFEIENYLPGAIKFARSIGIRSNKELDKELSENGQIFEYDDEDMWPGPVIHIITSLGMCLARCQQIEKYISDSFILGISKQQKKNMKQLTI